MAEINVEITNAGPQINVSVEGSGTPGPHGPQGEPGPQGRPGFPA